MKCIQNLAKAYLDSSRLRRRLVIWSIVLSTVLVLTIGNFYVMSITNDIMHYERKFAIYDGYYMNVTKRQMDVVSNNENIIIHTVCNQLNRKATYNNENKTFYLQNVNEEYMDKFNYRIQSGTYPKKSDEIALTESSIREKQVGIGDKVVLNLIDEDNKVQSKEFLLTGIIKDRGYDISKRKGFISDEYINDIGEDEVSSYMYFSVIDTLDKTSLIRGIAEKSGIDAENIQTKYGTQRNMSEYLVIALLVTFLSIITVSNIFTYNIVQRVNTIGLLKAVGMTNRQLKKLFLKEGLHYYLKGIVIGIPIGIVFNIYTFINWFKGTNDSKFSFWEYTKTYFSIGLENNSYLILLIVTLILQGGAVWLAIKIPSRKVKRMSIVNSIHYVDKIKVKKSKRKKIGLKSPVLKLAYANLNNNIFKTILSVITMSINVILFIYVTHYVSYTTSDDMVTRGFIGDIDVYHIDNNDMIYIDKIEGIENEFISVTEDAKIPTSEVTITDNYQEKVQKLQEYQDNHEDADIVLYSYNDNMLEAMYKYMRTPYTIEELRRMKNWCMVFDLDTFNEYDYKVGETFTINSQVVEIVGEISKYKWSKYITPPLLVSSDFIDNNYSKEELEYSRVCMNIDEDYYNNVKQKIKNRFEDNNKVHVSCIDEELKKMEDKRFYLVLLMYGLVAIIAAISLFMMINIIYTSIINRKKDFGVLRAVGMTKRQFKKYLVFEGNILIFFITIIGVPIGYVISKLGFDNFARLPENSGFVFEFPYWTIIIIPIYYIIIRIIIKMSINKMDKESVGDLIRYI
ncbi:hypothetical protein SH1V18_37750 [Vallitalea longa]|uniref:ABC3 transporter permease C-terminal domain-containing protein n=1 Tax=Vallitalea longa TaxID=2936439 RepID=A0A9W5YF00_9FIRM|nr:FtsX-like permease family protein [Vallitalea longa]GKX31295.1 hypothetical protein SH1V18_37750 [Vallitalea longa]